MKDADTPAPLGLDLITVPLPDIEDEYGNQVTSAVIDVVDPDLSEFVSNTTTTKPRGKWQDVGIAVARRLLLANGAEQISIDLWRDECKAAGMVRQNQHRVLESLSKRGDLIVEGESLSLSHL